MEHFKFKIKKLLENPKPPAALTVEDVDVIFDYYGAYHNAKNNNDTEMLEAIEGGVDIVARRVMAVDRYFKDTAGD